MRDYLDVTGLQYLIFDGFCDFEKIEGVLRMTGYRTHHGERVPLIGLDMMPSAQAIVKEFVASIGTSLSPFHKCETCVRPFDAKGLN